MSAKHTPGPWAPPFIPKTPVGDYGDNIFMLAGVCSLFARKLQWPQAWRDEFFAGVTSAPSYDAAIAHIRKFFTVSGCEDDAT